MSGFILGGRESRTRPLTVAEWPTLVWFGSPLIRWPVSTDKNRYSTAREYCNTAFAFPNPPVCMRAVRAVRAAEGDDRGARFGRAEPAHARRVVPRPSRCPAPPETRARDR